jgi:polyhydroxyalkanoate synthase
MSHRECDFSTKFGKRLDGSGHIARIVNPPAAKKYHCWTNNDRRDAAEEWFNSAARHPGTWWEDWQAWMDARNAGERIPARAPGSGSRSNRSRTARAAT